MALKKRVAKNFLPILSQFWSRLVKGAVRKNFLIKVMGVKIYIKEMYFDK
jgi:hypothetical protein